MTTDATTDPSDQPSDHQSDQTSGQPEISDNVGASRYEIRVGDVRAGMAMYNRTTTAITFTHTEIQPEYEGRGLAGKIAAVALDAARADGLRVVPRCPFFAEYIRRHPAYQDLVDAH